MKPLLSKRKICSEQLPFPAARSDIVKVHTFPRVLSNASGDAENLDKNGGASNGSVTTSLKDLHGSFG